MSNKKLELVNGVPKMVVEAGLVTIYDQSTTIGSGGLTTGSPLTLPSSQTYDSEELEVYVNNIRLEDTVDYNYVGTAPRTQVSFTFDLEENDVVRFRIDRSA